MENPANTRKAMDSGSININVERLNLMGGAGGPGGQATHSGNGGPGGLGEGARIFGRAQNVTINNNSDSNRILDTVLEAKLEQWLNAPDPKEKQLRFCDLENRSPCSWLFKDPKFIMWQTNFGGLLEIQGASGTGKTVISSMIIEQLFKDQASLNDINSTAIAYFYFDFTDLDKQSVENALRRLVLQLSRQSPVPYATLAQHYDSCKGQTVPTYLELLVILEKLLRILGRTYLVLDALNECKTEDHDRVVHLIHRMSEWSDIQLHVLVTSQPLDIFEKMFLSLKKLSRIRIHADTASDDIRLYISNELASKSELRRWKPEWGQIMNYITQKSAGMFRLAYCLLEQLKECVRLYDLQEALDSLPDNLHDIYARPLRSIPKKHLSDVHRLLHWLVFSERPLTLAQLEDTIAFDFSDSKHYTFDPRRRPKCGVFMKWLLVLVSIQPSNPWESMLSLDGLYRGDCTVRLAHSSVQDYLLLEQEKHPSSCISCPVHVIKEAAHRLTAQTCVCYLLHFSDHPLDATTFPNYPLATYVAKNWWYHLQRCSDRAVLSPLTMGLLEAGSDQYTALNRLDWNPYISDPNWQSCLNPPLYLCAILGYIEGVKFLLEGGSDANAVGVHFNNIVSTAVQAASTRGHLAIVHLLLQSGADVNTESSDGTTALQVASKNGHIEVVQLLLEKGADVNMKGSDGTALQLASAKGHLEITSLLLEKDADVNVDGRDGTPLQQASDEGHTEIVQLLLDKGADVNAAGDGTALQVASKKGHIEIVRLLLHKGADVNVNGSDGTALHVASAEGHLEITSLLLEKGADVNAQSRRYGSALHWATEKGHIEIVKLLLDMGADINAQVGWNGPALQLASEGGHIEIVRLLLEKGADINAQAGWFRNGTTAWQCAWENGHTNIVKLLFKHGAIPSVTEARQAPRRRASPSSTKCNASGSSSEGEDDDWETGF
ncbi:p-loop containing nucleoside triphosphate hydrolase [Mycena venus]|uniref:p-loop containing nucleoside triphosphate hydrolase n=1 Tax=Mycena venus TaxID=2733690 RepID=A0A8H6XGM9_9AGAR|nr:p-loop containing nucleoside triphosphate hydrolase [Mycena venus]